MNTRETYVRPKPNMLKATMGCLWLLFLLGLAAAVITGAVALTWELLG